ncbi:MAG: hypothetical protein PUD20_10335 [bacterium]|nr:hypothetical protein [bacterium]
MRRIVVAVAVILLGACIWKLARVNAIVPKLTDWEFSKASYSQTERVRNTIALSYLVYGCENYDHLSGTVSELLDEYEMGIIKENFSIIRATKADPASAVFDSAAFIKKYVGDFRLLVALKDSKSSFYGAAFCDDAKKCIWVTYCGSVSFQDTIACVGLAAAPGLTRQEKKAFELFEQVLMSDEVQKEAYSVILTGHSLGGAHAAMVSMVSGCEAVTVNGADGLAVDKINGILGEEPDEYLITNYLTSPKNGKFSYLDFVQRLMFLGSYKKVDCHIYTQNSYTTDAHSVFSYLTFLNDDFGEPMLPDESACQIHEKKKY